MERSDRLINPESINYTNHLPYILGCRCLMVMIYSIFIKPNLENLKMFQ